MLDLTGSPSGQTLRSAAAFFGSRSAAVHSRLAIYLACTALALAVSYVLGKEMAWDTLNYHLYAGFSAIHDRFAQDYFAAGPQGYLNPYAYVPFYALVALGLPALVVASILAVLQSVMLWLTFELALIVSPAARPWRRAAFATCAVAIAALNPILLQQLGTSFTDITTGELVLGGWCLLAATIRAPSIPRVTAAAVLLGVATAFKLTNAVHAVSAVTLLLFLPLPLKRRLGFGSAYGVALAASFMAVSAPWAYRLAKAFGNPFFPLLNGIFRSPEFTTEPLHHLRFVPSSLTEMLWRPFAMLDPVSLLHEELAAPDLRYAVLLVLSCVLLAQWVRKRAMPAEPSARVDFPVDARVLAALGCGFAVDWGAWLSTSGNSRYFLPMACVAAVLVVGVLLHAFATQPKVRNYIFIAIFAVQMVQLCMGTEFRWNGASWNGGKWFDVEMPKILATESALYLTMDTQSNSFIAPYLAPGAGLIDVSGSYPLGATAANRARVEALIRAYAPHLRFLGRGERLYTDLERRAPSVSQVNGALEQFALRADPSDCARITVRALPPELEIRFASSSSAPLPQRSAETTYLVSCALVPDNTDHSADIALWHAADIALDRLEDACPELFQPRRLPTDLRGSSARRSYMNTDLVAWVSHGEVKFSDPVRGDDMVALGRESDWLRTPPRLQCGRRSGHYFAKALGSLNAR